MSYPYESAASKEVGISLWVLDHHEWSWRRNSGSKFMSRAKLTAKCTALIAHDRILNGEIISRGLPYFYGKEPS